MDNKAIYKKTLTFSLRRFLWNVFAFIIIILVSSAGFFLADKAASNGLIGLAIGIIIGIIIVAIVSHFFSYIFKAGQIAMMTRAIADGKLPDDVYNEGKKIVKERFLTVAAYYAVTNVIKGIFNEIGKAITAVGNAIGGDTGSTICSTISSAINVVVGYLCDCCLGWVFYRKDEKSTKATLEGGVLFFKNGKTLAKNLGRIFGLGALSLLVVGGVFFGLFYLITLAFPEAFTALANEFTKLVAEDGNMEFLTNPNNLQLITAGIGGVIMWLIIHSTFVRPFILVGVLRNFIESGMKEKLTEKEFDELDNKSKKFAKLHQEVRAETK